MKLFFFPLLLAVQCAASTCAANLLENLTALLQQRRKCAETGGFFLLQRNSKSKNEKNIQKSRMSLELRQLELKKIIFTNTNKLINKWGMTNIKNMSKLYD